jgi:SAM-dependent methyltransferase
LNWRLHFEGETLDTLTRRDVEYRRRFLKKKVETAMDFSHFDTRNYPTLTVQEGYAEWASTYEETVLDTMDLRLLARIQSVAWDHIQRVADLACGTGRIGVWLMQQGVTSLDGVDLTAEMLEGARAKGIYRQLLPGNIIETPLQTEAYDLVTVVLADEHLPDVHPLYREGARIARPNGYFVIVGYHPFFLLSGIPTHFNRATGEPVTIQCFVHLLSDHVQSALAAGWELIEMHEGLVDDEWLARKPRWSKYKNQPVSFAMVWQKRR